MTTFEEWKEDYGLVWEPNYCRATDQDCEAAWNASAENSAEELAKQAERIKELEFSWAGCSQQLKDACSDLEAVEKQRDEQAAEISRLREVLTKCKKMLQGSHAMMIYKSDEVLAAIKKEGL